MELNSKSKITELVALATYLGDERFVVKLRDESFRSHVFQQKEFITKLLMNGFSILESSESEISISPASPKLVASSSIPSLVSPPPVSPSVPLAVPVISVPVVETSKVVQVSTEDIVGIERYIQNLIVEKTGYPLETVQPEVDLDDELGIDTVKKMEIFADLGSHFKLPLNADLNLSQLTTVKKMAQVVHQKIKELQTHGS